MIGEDLFKSDFAPPIAFYFSVRFDGQDDLESSFQEVSGLDVAIGMEEKKEDSDNNFFHHLSSPPNFGNLVLKRCLLYNSKLDRWCSDAIEDFKFDPKDIKMALLGANGGILASWTIIKAFPISWELSALNSTNNQ